MGRQDPVIEAYEYPATPWSDDAAGAKALFREVAAANLRSNLHPGTRSAGAGSAAGPSTTSGSSGSPDWTRMQSSASDGFTGQGFSSPSSSDSGTAAAAEQALAWRIAEAGHQGEERGRQQGIEIGLQSGLARGRDEAVQALGADRTRLVSQAAALTSSFAGERDRFLSAAEEETVRLALAIAARVLRREAQMDPLLLTGAVRVALGQLAASTRVRLHVPTPDLELWRQTLAQIPGLALRPEVVGEERMELGDCRMETDLGSTDLGLKAQLREIERGFFDRVGNSSATLASPAVPFEDRSEVDPRPADRESPIQRPESTRPEPTRPEPTRPDPARPDPARPMAARADAAESVQEMEQVL